ncbi:MAG: sigma-54 dependent transcriptional regulator [bacterium]
MDRPVKNVLAVDDDLEMRNALKEALERLDFNVVVAKDGEEALLKAQKEKFSLIVSDMMMPKMDGLSFLRQIRKMGLLVPVLIITGFGTIESAVEAMKLGAADYIMKPFSFDSLKKAIENLIPRVCEDKDLIYASDEMKKIVNLATGLAQSDITVLIYGESGTGKEVLARFIHKNSKRSDKHFVAVNCAAIPENLLESELFGYEKGAFTGAVERRIGKFEKAQNGTILLDEIGEMAILLQAKLLRVLQEKEFDRVGGKEPVKIDVRVIATTNRDLKKECEKGNFREDLYYRLNVFPIKLPPLRERKEDIEVLSEHFLHKYNIKINKNIVGIEKEAMIKLKNHYWKGNVRELENVIQRAVFMCQKNYISSDDLYFEEEQAKSNVSVENYKGSLRVVEKELIFKTLEETKWNKTKAADILGITVRTLRNKLKEYGNVFPIEEKSSCGGTING